ncbi:hypothetical protein GCM10020001_048510 [Nonomuraea salmonea]
MVGLVHERQPDLRQIDQLHVEQARAGGRVAEPVGHGTTGPTWAGAADDDLKDGVDFHDDSW